MVLFLSFFHCFTKTICLNKEHTILRTNLNNTRQNMSSLTVQSDSYLVLRLTGRDMCRNVAILLTVIVRSIHMAESTFEQKFYARRFHHSFVHNM